MNTFWRSKGSKAWVITSAIILILVLAVNIASSAFFDTVCIVLNSPQRTKLINEQNQYSILEGYNTREKAAEYGDQVTLNAAKEGFILLKNLDNALPLSKGAKVSVFGKNSVNIAYGGSGSRQVSSTIPPCSVSTMTKTLPVADAPRIPAIWTAAKLSAASPLAKRPGIAIPIK